MVPYTHTFFYLFNFEILAPCLLLPQSLPSSSHSRPRTSTIELRIISLFIHVHSLFSFSRISTTPPSFFPLSLSLYCCILVLLARRPSSSSVCLFYLVLLFHYSILLLLLLLLLPKFVCPFTIFVLFRSCFVSLFERYLRISSFPQILPPPSCRSPP